MSRCVPALLIVATLTMSTTASADDSRPATIRDPAMLKGGIAMLCVGVAFSMAGTFMLFYGPMSQFRSFDAADKTIFDWGLAAAIPGALGIIGGAFMIAEGSKPPVVSLLPAISPTGAALRFALRF